MPKIKIKEYNQEDIASAFSGYHNDEYSLMCAQRTNDYTDKDVVIFGIPFTTADHSNQGTNKGPEAVRRHSPYYSTDYYPYPEHYKLARLADGGNIRPANHTFSCETNLNDLKEQIKAELAKGDFRPVFVGGDHSLPFATLSAVSEHLGEPLCVLHFDAHPDSGEFDYPNQSAFMCALSRKGYIDPARTFQFFIRTEVHTEGEYRDISEQFTIYDGMDMHEQYRKDGFDAIVENVKDVVGQRPVWISFDMDCMDAAYAPATTFPVPCGATSQQIQTILYKLHQAGLNVYGGEVVELIPDLDVPSKITCGLATKLTRDFCIMSYHAHKRAKAK